MLLLFSKCFDYSVNTPVATNILYKYQISYLQVWLGDGKHSKMPTIIEQLYTIHIIHHGKVFPALYAFLPNKEQETYTELFRIILDHMDNVGVAIPSPQFVVLDFEKAAHNAVEDQLPFTKIVGCFFHLTQSVYRWVRSTNRSWDPSIYR